MNGREDFKINIPPLVVLLFYSLMMWLAAALLPGIELGTTQKNICSLVCWVLGAGFSLTGVIAFRRAHTTVNPRQPDKASELVITGIYRISRNPMYVGFSLLLTGWAIYLANLYTLPLLIGFIIYIDRYQIRPEEKILEAIFGQRYLAYKTRVRRWL